MNKKLLLKILFLIFVFILCWGVIWSWSITKTVRKNSKNDSMKNQHAIVKNIIATETRDEKKYWEFYAKSGEYDSEHNSVQLNDVIGNFYDDKEEVSVSFKSDKGTYDEKSKKVILNGNNLIVGRDGSQLYADELIWQGQGQDILANGNVQYMQNGKIVTKSKKAVFNSTLTNFKIIGNAIVKLYADDDAKKKYTQL